MRLLLATLYVFPFLLSAQTAPDFTVTDSDGNEHTLYADYLNQDKTVLIKIFFTSCPPCRSIASSMEIYYQEWGAGMHDVEFFELSVLSSDTDSKVNAYKDEFGITFPSVGSDGGSLQALQPYLDGEFGPYFGTPTFIVIAPDGTVQWDVDGSDLWLALDEALYETGALKPGDDPVDTTGMDDDTTVIPTPPVEFGGRIYSYASSQVGVSDVRVRIVSEFGMTVATDTTDTDGNYTFSLDSTMVADTILYIELFKPDDPKNGITATDLLLIQKHLLGLTPLEATEQLFASDANVSQSISASDLLFLKRLLLDIEEDFIDGISWLFYHSDISLGAAGDQPPQLESSPISVQDILDGVKAPDFRGIKRGDVNDTADY